MPSAPQRFSQRQPEPTIKLEGTPTKVQKPVAKSPNDQVETPAPRMQSSLQDAGMSPSDLALQQFMKSLGIRAKVGASTSINREALLFRTRELLRALEDKPTATCSSTAVGISAADRIENEIQCILQTCTPYSYVALRDYQKKMSLKTGSAYAISRGKSESLIRGGSRRPSSSVQTPQVSINIQRRVGDAKRPPARSQFDNESVESSEVHAVAEEFRSVGSTNRCGGPIRETVGSAGRPVSLPSRLSGERSMLNAEDLQNMLSRPCQSEFYDVKRKVDPDIPEEYKGDADPGYRTYDTRKHDFFYEVERRLRGEPVSGTYEPLFDFREVMRLNQEPVVLALAPSSVSLLTTCRGDHSDSGVDSGGAAFASLQSAVSSSHTPRNSPPSGVTRPPNLTAGEIETGRHLKILKPKQSCQVSPALPGQNLEDDELMSAQTAFRSAASGDRKVETIISVPVPEHFPLNIDGNSTTGSVLRPKSPDFGGILSPVPNVAEASLKSSTDAASPIFGQDPRRQSLTAFCDILPKTILGHAVDEEAILRARQDAKRWRDTYCNGILKTHRKSKRDTKLSSYKRLVHPETGDSVYPLKVDANHILDCFNLKVIYERDKTGFQESREFRADVGSLIAGRYRVISSLGEAAFSKAYECCDVQSKDHKVCVKMIRNDKDYIDQSMDEIQLLRYVKANADPNTRHCLDLYDHFYFQEHLFLVTELLGDNLYSFGMKVKELGVNPYFTVGRIQKIAYQLLLALTYIHSLRLIHCDLKPENILMFDDSEPLVKIIDFGSSCFEDDRLSTYVQSRSYRSPEVLLGLAYDQKIDMWSLGCILAELYTGFVLFQNKDVPSMIARIAGILGPLPYYMVARGKNSPSLFSTDGQLYAYIKDPARPSVEMNVLLPKRSSLRQRLRTNDDLFYDFIEGLLQIDPCKRPTANEALMHEWLRPGQYGDGLQCRQA